jgi:hypothetical protein
MDYSIKDISEEEFFLLAALHHKMVLSSPFSVDSVMASTEALLTVIRAPASIKQGLYAYNADTNSHTLVGFMTGYAMTQETYFWAGLYVEPRYRSGVKLLIDQIEELIKALGFKAIEADGVTSEGIAMMERYEYTPKMTRYRKELVWAE